MTKERLKKIIIIDLVIVIAVIAGFFIYMGQDSSSSQNQLQTDVAEAPSAVQNLDGVDIGGPFSMVDHNGKAVTDQSYGDSYKMIYFGFTFCPHICPTELQKMAAIFEILGDQGEQILPIFVTTDPERDTPDVMKEYVSHFHPRMIGLTGSLEQVKNIQDEYRVYAAKAEDPQLSDYTMNHSSYMYLVAPDNTLLGLYSEDSSPSDIAKNIQAVLNRRS